MKNSELANQHEPFYSDGVRFGCSRCSLCCRFDSGFVWLSRADLAALSDGLHSTQPDIISDYCRTVDLGGFRQLSLAEQPNKDCVFWRDGGCSVYGFRPLQCRSFPFWAHQLASEQTWNESARHCPGIGVGPLHGREQIEEWIELRRFQPPLNADTLP